MSQACPLSFEKTDANVSRISAVFVTSLLIAYLYNNEVSLLYFLFSDFFVKVFLKNYLSPITFVAKVVQKIFSIEKKMVDSGAKRLAALFGLVFVAMLLVTHYLVLYKFSFVIAAVFISCSLLDLFFDFCIACKIYYIIKRFYPNFMTS